jgi:hypothetical protein
MDTDSSSKSSKTDSKNSKKSRTFKQIVSNFVEKERARHLEWRREINNNNNNYDSVTYRKHSLSPKRKTPNGKNNNNNNVAIKTNKTASKHNR